MNYKEAIDRLKTSHQLGSKLGLGRMRTLMEELGDPQDELKIIHVGGTNGKGSVCTFLTQILKENGYRVGTFLSPYLESPLDAILLEGEEIPSEDFLDAAKTVFEAADSIVEKTKQEVTEFELLTAIAFVAFKNKAVDFMILEVGLGGREDATNIVKSPLLSVITSIAIDHKGVLGDTVEKIAREKAGIIKNACPVVSNVKDEKAQVVIKKKADEMGSPFYDATVFEAFDIEKDIRGYSFIISEKILDSITGSDFRVQLGTAGEHQISNGICAIYVVNQLIKMGIINIRLEKLLKALAESRQKGRLEIINENPLIIADGAHNVEGVKALKRLIEEHFLGKKILLVLGMIKGKEVELIVKELCPLGSYIVTTEPESSLRFKSEKLCKIVEKVACPCESLGPMRKAMKYIEIVKQEYDVIIITGSLYLAGKVRSYFKSNGGLQ